MKKPLSVEEKHVRLPQLKIISCVYNLTIFPKQMDTRNYIFKGENSLERLYRNRHLSYQDREHLAI